tara:strand:- start:474 stop:2858 length:2385 start_codon:yes stop_codon:yes gene_type:complete
MKNKLILSIIIIFCFQNNVLSQGFTFKGSKIEIIDKGNQINAVNGKAVSNDNNIEISSDKFEYLKNKGILNSIGNGSAQIKSKNLKIKYDNAIFDEKNLIFEASGNIEILEVSKNFIIKNNKIYFDQKKNIIKSKNTTSIEDKFGNIYFADSFIYEIDNNLIKVKELISKDNQNNTFKTSLAYINTKSGKVFGKDVKINLKNSSIIDNDFRLKGNSVTVENNISEITKGVFTTCKKRDDCPPWQLSAKKIRHDKKKREISYDNTTLKLYDIPVAYFPKFFHPDPTVKRRTGFLVPSIKNSSNFGNYLNTPFFYAFAENKDFTFSPRFYTDEKILMQTEYRQKNLNTNHIADFSFFTKKNGSSKRHFFYEFDKDFTAKRFDNSEINLKIQTTSNDTYLKSNKLKSQLNNENNILENSINLDLYSNDLTVNLSSVIYENLDKLKSDRYEYILPKLQITKNFNEINLLNGNFQLKSKSLARNYDTNIYEKHNINDLIFKSNPKINRYGFLNNYEFLFRNSNTDNKNSDFKNEKNFFLSGIYQYNSSLPMKKESDIYRKIFSPKIALKIAPNHTKNDRDKERKIDLNNIYSLTRTVDGQSIEGGISSTYGFDYSISDKTNNNEIFNFKFANNLRLKENDDLSNTNQIGEKTSNFFTGIEYKPNNIITTKYTSSFKNNLNNLSNENLVTEFKVNNFVTTFDYLNENNTASKTSFLSNKTSFLIDNSSSFSFSTRKNKTKDITEYYQFMYQYKNDCLAASIEYNKDFYTDRDLKPDESILFKLNIIPFAEATSPNLKEND